MKKPALVFMAMLTIAATSACDRQAEPPRPEQTSGSEASALDRSHKGSQMPDLTTTGAVVSGAQAFRTAGLGPADIDVAQLYDSFTITVLLLLEDLGFCPKGEAAAFVRERDLTFRGDFPHNTSGGQLSVGQAGAAGGYLGLVEAMRQLCGMSGANQVKDAEVALVSGFGMINYDRGLASAAALLARAS